MAHHGVLPKEPLRTLVTREEGGYLLQQWLGTLFKVPPDVVDPTEGPMALGTPWPSLPERFRCPSADFIKMSDHVVPPREHLATLGTRDGEGQ